MPAKLFIALFVVVFSLPSLARIPCNLAKEFGNPKLANNAKFWKEVEPIVKKGDAKALSAHFKKYGVDSAAAAKAQAIARTPSVPTQPAYRMTPAAAKDLRNLPPASRKGLDGVLDLLRRSDRRTFYGELNTRGGVRIVKLGDGSRAMSLRTKDNYQVLFREKGEGFEIVKFSKIR